jgi:uroporphyrinogen-III synthase
MNLPPIVAIRPEPGLSSTIARAIEVDLEIRGEPLFEVVPVRWDPPPPQNFDALLIGSANAIRQAGEALDLYRDLPIHAVGATTAMVAQEFGLHVASVGEGGLQDVLDAQPDAMRYLRLTGRAHMTLDARRHREVTTRIVYESVALPIGAALAELLREGALVLLHSGEAARHFAAECNRLKIDRANVRLVALGSRIAAAAGTGWQAVDCPIQPNEGALFALLRDMRA